MQQNDGVAIPDRRTNAPGTQPRTVPRNNLDLCEARAILLGHVADLYFVPRCKRKMRRMESALDRDNSDRATQHKPHHERCASKDGDRTC